MFVEIPIGSSVKGCPLCGGDLVRWNLESNPWDNDTIKYYSTQCKQCTQLFFLRTVPRTVNERHVLHKSLAIPVQDYLQFVLNIDDVSQYNRQCVYHCIYTPKRSHYG